MRCVLTEIFFEQHEVKSKRHIHVFLKWKNINKKAIGIIIFQLIRPIIKISILKPLAYPIKPPIPKKPFKLKKILISLSNNVEPKTRTINNVDKPIKKYPSTSITHIIELGFDITNNSRPEELFGIKASCK